MADLDKFVSLSAALTGLANTELPAAVEQQDSTGATVPLSQIYLDRLHKAFPAELGELIAAWIGVQNDPDPTKQLGAKLAGGDEAARRLRVAARQVIKIWYLSTIDNPAKPLDPTGKNSGQLGGDLGQFQCSAVWKLIGAPVTGYSNFPHGYWAQRPEE
jgi:hypothetical protein